MLKKHSFEILVHVDKLYHTISADFLGTHFYAVNLQFYNIQKVYYWVQIQWPGEALKSIQLIVINFH